MGEKTDQRFLWVVRWFCSLPFYGGLMTPLTGVPFCLGGACHSSQREPRPRRWGANAQAARWRLLRTSHSYVYPAPPNTTVHPGTAFIPGSWGWVSEGQGCPGGEVCDWCAQLPYAAVTFLLPCLAALHELADRAGFSSHRHSRGSVFELRLPQVGVGPVFLFVLEITLPRGSDDGGIPHDLQVTGRAPPF